MSVLDYLDKLRQRPEAERQRLVVWFSLAVTLGLLVLWLLNLRFLWQNTPSSPTVAAEVASESGLGETLAAGWERIKIGWQIITTAITTK